MPNRREQAAEIRSTWMVTCEPEKTYPSRRQRLANRAQALSAARVERKRIETRDRADTATMQRLAEPYLAAQEAVQVPMPE